MVDAEGTFEVTSMNEDEYQHPEDGARLTRANGTQRFVGDIVGAGSVEWLMSYMPDGRARFIGVQRIVGSLNGRAGSFLIEATGSFDGASSKGSWVVIAGSGTGELRGLQGDGGFAASGQTAEYHLEHRFE